jgi:hypothetical protein
VPRIRHAQATFSPSALRCGRSGSLKLRSGNARQLVRMNSWTATIPRAGAGSAGSCQTMSSVSSGAIASASKSFHAAA